MTSSRTFGTGRAPSRPPPFVHNNGGLHDNHHQGTDGCARARAFCVLAGLAIGQLTQAQSAGSSDAPQLRAIATQLRTINGSIRPLGTKLDTISREIGSSTSIGSANYYLYAIKSGTDHLSSIDSATSGTCRATAKFGC